MWILCYVRACMTHENIFHIVLKSMNNTYCKACIFMKIAVKLLNILWYNIFTINYTHNYNICIMLHRIYVRCQKNMRPFFNWIDISLFQNNNFLAKYSFCIKISGWPCSCCEIRLNEVTKVSKANAINVDRIFNFRKKL